MKKIMYGIILALLIAAIVFVAIDGTFSRKLYREIYNEKYIDEHSDIEKIIAYAMGAASSHNMQPWLIKIIDENTIELYADMNKQLKVIDADNSQMLISQGTFLRRLLQGAELYGCSAAIEYADAGFNSDMPLIARITIEKSSGSQADTIASATIESNSKNAQPISEVVKNAIDAYEGFSYVYIDSESDMKELQAMLMQGTIIESNNEAAVKELLSVFRWTERDKNEYRYGLSLNSMPALMKPFVQPIMESASRNTEAFGKSSVKMFEDSIKSDIGYILIISDEAQEMDYIKSGEIYQSLVIEGEGYALRPAVQVLEKFDDMLELNGQFQKQYAGDGQVMLIIRVQQAGTGSTSANPRHLLEDIIIE